MIDTLVFDFDGVIIDTEKPDFETWQQEFGYHGVELDRALWSGIIGGSHTRFDVFGHLQELVGRELDEKAVRTRRLRRYLDIVESSPLLPGILDYLTGARDRGLKVGVASSSNRDWVGGHLTRLGLMKYFATVRCSDDVDSVKPEPDLFLAAVEGLGSSPKAAVAIEDSANGVTAALRAGLFCVVVPNDMTKDLAIDEAHVRLDALSDLPLDELLDRARSEHH